MKTEFKPIAMRCTEKQFDELKPILKKYDVSYQNNHINNISKIGWYLTNDYNGNKIVSATGCRFTNRELIETFNADLFLQCCGIELEETFTLTKSEIIENKDKTLKEMFKDVFEVELEVGKWYKHKELEYFFCFNGSYEHYSQYGFTRVGWSINISSDKCHLHNFIPATEEEVETALLNECKKMYKGNEIKCLYGSDEPVNKDFNKWSFDLNSNKMHTQPDCMGGKLVFDNGKWATIIEQKEMTVAEIEKELGYNIKIIK